MSKIKVYIGCSLTHSPQDFKNKIDKFKSRLRKHVEILDFLGLNAPSAKVAFDWDISCVKNADLVIFDLTHESIGAGIEWGVAMQLNKPIITLAQKNTTVSRFPFGYDAENHFSYRYESHKDAFDFVMRSLPLIFHSTVQQ